MNKEQGIAGNKLIAEFMGGKPYRVMVKSIGMMDAYQWGENDYTIDELQYHSSWDWLIPVVEKIVHSACEMPTIELRKEAGKRYDLIQDQLCNFIISEVHFYSVQFIQWYNQQSK